MAKKRFQKSKDFENSEPWGFIPGFENSKKRETKICFFFWILGILDFRVIDNVIMAHCEIKLESPLDP